MSHIFISYSRKDTEVIDQLAAGLEQAGYNVWVDKHEIRAGKNWVGELVKAIETADMFILALSPQSADSTYVNRELHHAVREEIPIQTILLEEFEVPSEIAFLIGGVQHILYQDADKAIKELVEVAQEHAAKISEAQPQPETAKVELLFKGLSLDQMDEKLLAKVQEVIAQEAGVSKDRLEVVSVEKGSVIITIELPTDGAFELRAAALNDDLPMREIGLSGVKLVDNHRYVELSLPEEDDDDDHELEERDWKQIGCGAGIALILVAVIAWGAGAFELGVDHPTPTPTPSYTATASPEPDATLTNTPQPVTHTSSPTAENTQTPTTAASATTTKVFITFTPTFTPSATATATPTKPPTRTATPTPTITATVVPTVTPTETAGPAPAPAAPLGTIEGYIYVDDNINGGKEDGEDGLPNVVVRLYEDNCGGPLIAQATSNGDGLFVFNDIPEGPYCVEVDSGTLPPGVQPTHPNGHSYNMYLNAGQTYDSPNIWFGYSIVDM